MKNKYQIIELCIIFLLTLIFNLTCNTLTHDEVWNYGFAYNIANGLIPYKDFNMVITPLFPILGAIFMTIFGKNLVIYHIFNAIICTWIFYYMKKNNSKSYYIPYFILLFNALPNYSLFCILLLYILMDMENKKTENSVFFNDEIFLFSFSYYIVFFVVIYYVIKVICKSYGFNVKKFFSILLEGVLGTLLASVVLIPSLLFTISNPRINSNFTLISSLKYSSLIKTINEVYNLSPVLFSYKNKKLIN